jgi:hypothetical protein
MRQENCSKLSMDPLKPFVEVSFLPKSEVGGGGIISSFSDSLRLSKTNKTWSFVNSRFVIILYAIRTCVEIKDEYYLTRIRDATFSINAQWFH